MSALSVRRNSDHRNQAPDRDPFGNLDHFHREMAAYLGARPGLGGHPFTPLADLEESEDAYLIEIEVPGVKAEDLDIEISGRKVSVRGERKEKERVGVLRKRERTVGRFSYEVTLPGAVEEDSTTAQLDEGVLTMRLPKPEAERPRRIPIR